MKPKHQTITDDLGNKHTIKTYTNQESRDIEKLINDAADKINNECPGLFAHKLKLEWIREE